MLISLVIPVLNEAATLPHLWCRLEQVAVDLPQYAFEILFIDDGSTDDTAEAIRAIDPPANIRLKLVELSRNFGHQVAISAGMRYAAGEALIFLDADLQDPPEMIPEFLAKFREGFDVVYGVRQNRKEPLLLRLCFTAFYRFFNAVAQRPIPLDAGDFSLVSRRVAQFISEMPEHDRLIRGLRSWVGFKQIGIPYDRPERLAGQSKYNVSRRIEGALDGIFSFSRLPIRCALLLGTVVIFVGVSYLGNAYFHSLFLGGVGVPGWKSLITLGFMAAGANILVTAVVGEYVSRIYFQTKGRPLYVVQSVIEKKRGADAVSIEPGGER
jgi:glycosyltransferase involved in cell wall biosynthesis